MGNDRCLRSRYSGQNPVSEIKVQWAKPGVLDQGTGVLDQGTVGNKDQGTGGNKDHGTVGNKDQGTGGKEKKCFSSSIRLHNGHVEARGLSPYHS